MSAETPSANVVRKAWDQRGYRDALKARPSAVEAARARGGESAATAYATGYKRGVDQAGQR